MTAETTKTTKATAWTDLMAHLGEFSSAVLTGVDAQGYPYSARCHPQPDAATKTLRIPVLPGTLIEPGPAGLLCHWHDERLWNQRSFLVRGTLARDGAQWRFEPRHYVQGAGYGGALGMMRFVVGARGSAQAYLAKRGLPRPSIPWDKVIAAKRQAQPPRRPSQRANPALAAAAAIGIVGVCSLLIALLLANRRR